jgi:hypothetical protein
MPCRYSSFILGLQLLHFAVGSFPQANADRLSFLRLARSPEYRLCGRSLRTAMPQCLLLPDQHEQPLAASDPRVDPCDLWIVVA